MSNLRFRANRRRRTRRIVLVALACALSPAGSFGATYDVGPGQPYAAIGDVPLESLAAGDLVRIHWRAEPYREKWVIGAAGTETDPLVFRGIPGPAGELPVIDGDGAVTRLALDFWSEQRGIVKVGGSSIPEAESSTHVVIESLEIRGARAAASFLDDTGASQQYSNNAACIYVERGQFVTIRNCILHDSGNGLFVASGDEAASQDILIEGNQIFGNGNAGSIYEHNTYTAAIRITYQYNRFGPLLAGAGGNNLKDRSAGLVVRYNWIEGGNRQLDLVDAEDSALIRSDPDYPHTFVYGNVLVEPAGAGNRQLTHYGGDSGAESWYRKGWLYFYHNTIVSTRTDRTTLWRLSTMDEQCDARNNIFFTTHAGSDLALLDDTGVLYLSHNWVKPGWVQSFGGTEGIVHDDGTWLTGSDPLFADAAAQGFMLRFDSPAVDYAAALHPAVPVEHAVVRQYAPDTLGLQRQPLGAGPDLGAFERLPWDFDADLDADHNDFAVLTVALGGPDLAPAPPAPLTAAACLATFDRDSDDDLDLSDAATLQVVVGRLVEWLP